MKHLARNTKDFQRGLSVAEEFGHDDENIYALRDVIISIMKDDIKECDGYTLMPDKLNFLSGVMSGCRSRIRRFVFMNDYGGMNEWKILPFTLALVSARLIFNGKVDVINPKY
jgi:hypothetical protein